MREGCCPTPCPCAHRSAHHRPILSDLFIRPASRHRLSVILLLAPPWPAFINFYRCQARTSCSSTLTAHSSSSDTCSLIFIALRTPPEKSISNPHPRHRASASFPATLCVAPPRALQALEEPWTLGSSISLHVTYSLSAMRSPIISRCSPCFRSYLRKYVHVSAKSKADSITTHMTSSSSFVRNVIATPILPARPVRPEMASEHTTRTTRTAGTYQYDARTPLSCSPSGS